MERTILVIVVIVIIAAGYGALGGAILNQHNAGVDPSQYVTKSGDCWVAPQGDPLYDAHYAQEVNPYNCQSYKVQEQANNIKAETRKVNAETGTMLTASYSLFGFVGLGLVVLVLAIIKGVTG